MEEPGVPIPKPGTDDWKTVRLLTKMKIFDLVRLILGNLSRRKARGGVDGHWCGHWYGGGRNSRISCDRSAKKCQ